MTPVPSDENEADSRRAKKRELDRRAQRAARERNRNRIALLEATIEAMKKEDSGRRAAQLIEELTQVKKERDDLENTLQSIKDLITPHGPFRTSSNPTRNPPLPNKQPEVETGVTSDASPSESIGMTATMDSIFDARTMADPPPTAPQQHAQFMIGLDGELPLDPSFIPLPPLADGLIVPEPLNVCDCMLPPAPVISTISSSTPKTSIWRKANEILGLQYPLSESMLQVEDELCEDFPVRILLDGWDSVNTQNLPLLWQTLRQTDILQFQTCSDTERLAILILMHRLLRYRADTAAETWSKIPPWLLSRPSQSLPHSPAIDFFVWPGVRERFVFLQHQYCSNHFWKVFAESFRLSWPFEFRDCYQKSAITGRYSLSEAFESRLYDINSWTMTMDFFYHFPDFQADIPCSQYIPRLQLQTRGESQESVQSSTEYLA